MNARGFEEIKRELDVLTRVEKLEKDYIRIKQALNLGNNVKFWDSGIFVLSLNKSFVGFCEVKLQCVPFESISR
jgi:hypothetical protein